MKKSLLSLFGILACWCTSLGQITAPFTESFDNKSLPAGWTNSTSTPWKFSGYMSSRSDAWVVMDPDTTSWFAYLDPNPSNGYARNELSTDTVDVSGLSDPQLQFQLSSFNPNWVNLLPFSNTFSIDIYDGTVWNMDVYTFTGSFDEPWKNFTIDLAPFSSSGQIVLRFNATSFQGNHSIAIDNIEVNDKPSCPAPEALTITNISGTSAIASWSSTTNGHTVVKWGPTGSRTITTDTTVLLSGLADFATYNVYIKDSCSTTDESPWVGPVSFTTCGGPLAGNYTLDPLSSAANNFKSFGDLAGVLNTCGVSGPVRVDVAPGQYNEQLLLKDIPGVSVTDTVVINGNGAEILFTSTSYLNKATVEFNNTQFVTLDSLKIAAKGRSQRWLKRRYDSTNVPIPEYSQCITILNNSDHNRVSNCKLLGDTAFDPTVYTPNNFSAVIYLRSRTGQVADNNIFKDNEVLGGITGIFSEQYEFHPTPQLSPSNNKFVGNIVQKWGETGIYIWYHKNIKIEKNDVSEGGVGFGSQVRAFGIWVQKCNSPQIIGNRIHDIRNQPLIVSGKTYDPLLNGINVRVCSSPVNNPGIVGNNIFYNLYPSGLYNFKVAALAFDNSSNLQILNNTFVVIDLTPVVNNDTRVVQIAGYNENLRVSNNLFYVDYPVNQGNHSIYQLYTDLLPSYRFDYNTYYFAPGSDSVKIGRTNTGRSIAGKLTGWQSFTGMDKNSTFSDPLFIDVANNNFIPRSATVADNGVDITTLLPLDILDTLRSNTPDRGAYEFDPAPCTGVGRSSAKVSSSTATISWKVVTDSVTVYWGPRGFQPGTNTANTVPAGDSVATITGLNSGTCYEYYLQQHCNSSIPGAPPLQGPFEFCTECTSALNGTYTVGGSNGPNNFGTLDAAVAALYICGISGPVVFDLQGGRHEPVWLTPVKGSSATNTITFNGSSIGDSIIATQPGAPGKALAAIELEGVSYVTFNNLYIENQGFFDQNEFKFHTIWLHNHAQHIAINNCEIVGDNLTDGGVVAGSSRHYGIYGGMNAEHVSISNCTISGNKYGTGFYGLQPPSSDGSAKPVYSQDIQVDSCTFQNQYGDVIFMHTVSSLGLRNNLMTKVPGVQGGKGINVRDARDIQITGNQVYGYQSELIECNADLVPTTRSVIANNIFAANASGEGGLRLNVNHFDIVHNTITGGYYPLHLGKVSSFGPPVSDLTIRNNIFASDTLSLVGSIWRSNKSLLLINQGVTPDIDHNLYFSPDSVAIATQNGVSHYSLSDWKTAVPTQNANSVEGDPVFVSNFDFHLKGLLANDAGDNSVGITQDFEGDIRPATGASAVDIGADEYSPLATDVLITKILSPNDNDCGDSNAVVKVVIKSLGAQATTNIPVDVEISGQVGTTVSATYTGTLNFNESDTLSLPPFASSIGGVMHIKAFTAVSTDQDITNDTLIKTVTILDGLVRTPLADLDSFCTGDYATLFFPPNSEILSFEWETSSNTSLGTTDSLVVGPLGANDTTFILKAKSALFSTGPKDTTNSVFSGMSIIPAAMTDLKILDRGVRLDTVHFYPDSAGTYGFVIRDSSSMTELYAKTVTVPATAVGTKVPIGFDIALNPGAYKVMPDMRLPLLKVSGYQANFPYLLSGIAKINSAFPNGMTTLYEWQFSTGYCSRPDGKITLYNGESKALFTANIGSPTTQGTTVNFDASLSRGADTYQWSFGDGGIDFSMSPSHTYTSNGSYTVELIITGECGSDTLRQQITITGIGQEENTLEQGLKVYPNPTEDVVTIFFKGLTHPHASIFIRDVSGKLLYSRKFENVNGKLETPVDLSRWAKGVYMIEVTSGSMHAYRKVTKQ